MLRIKTGLAIIILLMGAVASVSAENYVNWKGGFWLHTPDNWEKVDYKIVDRMLALSDTARDVFMYEAVFAPKESRTFISGPYMVITFDETGGLSEKAADSLLESIASSYATDVLETPEVNRLADMIPGRPRLNRKEKTVSVLSEMAYRSNAKTKLWLFMKLNTKGLITLYMYCPDSLYNATKPVFERIVSSLSFDSLKQAADQGKLTFTEVGGTEGSSAEGADNKAEKSDGTTGFNGWILYAGIAIVVIGILWFLVIAPRMKKEKNESE